MSLGGYRRALDVVSQGVLRSALQLVAAMFSSSGDVEKQIDVMAPLLTDVVRRARQDAHAHAVAFMREQATEQGVEDPVIEAAPGYSEQSVRTALRENLKGSPDEAAQAVASTLVRHTEAAARDTVIRSVDPLPDDEQDELEEERPWLAKSERPRLRLVGGEDEPDEPEPEGDDGEEYDRPSRRRLIDADTESTSLFSDPDGPVGREDFMPAALIGMAEFTPTAEQAAAARAAREDPGRRQAGERKKGTRAKTWARVLTGAENCPFCVMLASRGPVYSSAEEAGQIDGPDYAEVQPYINRFHDNCDCVVVPVYSYASWPGKDQYRELEKLWKDVTKGIKSSGSKYRDNDALKAFDQYLRQLEKDGGELPVDDMRAAA